MHNLFDRLLISSPNGGGLFLISNNCVLQLDSLDTTGLNKEGGTFLRGLQSSILWVCRKQTLEITNETVRLDDIHDVLFHRKSIYLVGTANNEIIKLNQDGKEIKKWSFDGKDDSHHINCLGVWDKRIIFSAFGEFYETRGYKGNTLEAGYVQDLLSQKRLIDGLSQPHSLVPYGQNLLVANSEKMEIREYAPSGDLIRTRKLDGYTRGICFSGKVIYVGLSRSRNIEEGTIETAVLVALDYESWDELDRLSIPVNEIYSVLSIASEYELLDIITNVSSHSAVKLGGEITRLTKIMVDREKQVKNVNLELKEQEYKNNEKLQQLELRNEVLEKEQAEAQEIISGRESQVKNVSLKLKGLEDKKKKELLKLELRNEALKKEQAEAQEIIADRENQVKNASLKLKELEDKKNKELNQLQMRNEMLEKEQAESIEKITHFENQASMIKMQMNDLDERTSQELHRLHLTIEQLGKELADSRNFTDELLGSHSWRVMAPFRWGRFVIGRLLRGEYLIISRILRFIYVQIPIQANKKELAKNWSYTYFPLFFRHTLSFEVWIERSKKLGERLSFPVCVDPKVTIIIPVYGKIEYTHRCLSSINKILTNSSFEVIVIDDCSPDDTANVLNKHSGIRVLKNKNNIGFIRSCNKGADEARGEYLLFLNNDTEVLEGWLDELINTFDKFPETGLVGSKLLYPDGSLQEAGGIIWHDATGWNYGRGDDPNKPEYNYVREVDYCSGAAIMIPKKVFMKLGKFDERYIPAYYEDTDLAFSVQQAGFKVIYQPASRIIHFEGVTSGSDLNSGVKAYQVSNQTKFLEKWKERLGTHGKPGEEVFVERDRHASGRILIIDAVTPTPDQDSGSLDILFFQKIFIDLGYKVTFVPDNLVFIEGYTQPLQQLGVECLYAPHITSVEDYLKEHGRNFDFVFLYRAWTANSHFKNVKRHCPQARIVFDTVDLHYLREERQAALTGSKELAAQAKLTKEVEFRLMREADATIILSEAEVKMLKNIDSSLRLEYIPYVREIPGCNNQFGNRRDILFIGGFEHTPNVDAVEYFVKEIWLIVRKTLSNTSFYIIGSKMPDSVRELEQYEGVVVVGFVKDLADFFDNCRLTVVPLRYGAGIKGKIGTSASYGVPSVATTIAIEGMGMVDGKHILVADDADLFAEKIVTLYNDESLWNKLSQESLNLVDKLYSYKAGKRRLFSLLRSLKSNLPDDLEITSINSLEDFKKRRMQLNTIFLERIAYENSLLGSDKQPFQISGKCRVCGEPRKFSVDYSDAYLTDKRGVLQPNWRETLICEGCGLNNRVRAAADFFMNSLCPNVKSQIYVTEQLTPFYRWVKAMFPTVIGSEFLGAAAPSEIRNELRNEDLTALSFQNQSIDFILSFDVLEHIPDYRKAISECSRCLVDGGIMMISVPFLPGGYKTLVRARLSDKGEVEHLLPPEYHGNPTQPSEGSLCYYHFGWELLDIIKEEGFEEAHVETIYSQSYAYLGEEQILLIAKK